MTAEHIRARGKDEPEDYAAAPDADGFRAAEPGSEQAPAGPSGSAGPRTIAASATDTVQSRQALSEAGAGQSSDEPWSPPGWTYNPSAWPQRIPALALALLNCGIAFYLALCEIGVVGRAWDPFFGSGTVRVLNSPVSRAFPVPDAALGAFAYLLEAASIGFGGLLRWRTKPWLVLSFAILTIPLGITSIVLLMLQPIVVHAWCTLCLFVAIGMLLLAALMVDEVAAAIQNLWQAFKDKCSIWDAFLHGGPPVESGKEANRASEQSTGPLQGFSVPWSLAACIGLGVWLLVSPPVLDTRGNAAAADVIAGALVLAAALIACAEVVRPVRFLCTVCGVWLLIVAPWSLTFSSRLTRPNEVVVGVCVILLSAIRPRRRERYGVWDRVNV